nr:MAG TPA_asm: hypothetical protein [Bacteriophage sp.]
MHKDVSLREKTTSSILKNLVSLVEEICICLDSGLEMVQRIHQNSNPWIQR